MKTISSAEHHRPQDILEDVFIPDQNQFNDLAIPSEAFQAISEEKRGGAVTRFTVQIPETILDPVPLLIVHGYCGPEVIYEKFREAVAANGKPAITYRPTRTQDMSAAFSRQHRLHPERLLTQTALGALYGSAKLLKKKGHAPDAYDISGHSMGGRGATKVAHLHPEFVRTVILNEAAGLDGHSFTDFLSQRFPAFVAKELTPALLNSQFAYRSSRKIVMQGAEYILKNPYKTVSEALTAGGCDIKEDVSLLGKLGVASSILVAESDTMISAAGTARKSGHASDLFAVYGDPKANHLYPFTHPLETALTHLQIIEALHINARSRPLAAAA